jgi:hypothetical protein
MVQAESWLSGVTRISTPKGDEAELQVTALLRLYRRKLGQKTETLSRPAGLEDICYMMELPPSHPSTQILTAIPGSPPLDTPSSQPTSFTGGHRIPVLSPSISASTDVSAQLEDDLCAGGDTQLTDYEKERSVTWDDIKNRPRLFGGEEMSWRYSTAEDMCRGTWV